MADLSAKQDLLVPAEIASRLRHTIFGDEAETRHFDSIGSTNTAAMQAAMQGAPEGALFLAEEQLAGRGRGGHSWHSEAGSGIYVSAILRPEIDAGAALALSLIAGIAVHDAVRDVCGIKPDLRWPNDVLIGTKKVAGILTETSADMHRMHHAVVGIGLNVNQSAFPAELALHATSVRIESSRAWPRLELLVALLESLDCQYRALKSDPAATISTVISDFEARSSYVRDVKISVHERDAAEAQYTGKTQGLDARGFLKVETESGMRTLLSGGIRKL